MWFTQKWGYITLDYPLTSNFRKYDAIGMYELEIFCTILFIHTFPSLKQKYCSDSLISSSTQVENYRASSKPLVWWFSKKT